MIKVYFKCWLTIHLVSPEAGRSKVNKGKNEQGSHSSPNVQPTMSSRRISLTHVLFLQEMPSYYPLSTLESLQHFSPRLGRPAALGPGGVPREFVFRTRHLMFFGQKSGWQCNCLLLPVSSRCLREEPDYRTNPSFLYSLVTHWHTWPEEPDVWFPDPSLIKSTYVTGHSIVNPSTTLFSLSHNDTLGLGHSIAWTTLPILSVCHHPLVTLLRLPWVVTLCVIMPPSLVTLLIHLTWAGLWITICDIASPFLHLTWERYWWKR